MIQLLCHLCGDYLTQSDWMAQNKTKNSLPAAAHALVYGLPFLFLGSWKAVAVIIVTHFIIDRWCLARYVVWAKNWIGPYFQPVEVRLAGTDVIDKQWRYKQPTPTFGECRATGYPPETPVWLSTWLMIIADNTIHLMINYLALKWL